MASLSDDDILDAVRRKMKSDSKFRQDLGLAVEAKSNSWIQRLIRVAVGIVIEIGRAVLAAITGWFFG